MTTNAALETNSFQKSTPNMTLGKYMYAINNTRIVHVNKRQLNNKIICYYFNNAIIKVKKPSA